MLIFPVTGNEFVFLTIFGLKILFCRFFKDTPLYDE